MKDKRTIIQSSVINGTKPQSSSDNDTIAPSFKYIIKHSINNELLSLHINLNL